MPRYLLGITTLLFTVQAGSAHFSMLLPAKPMAMKGEKVAFVYQFGHPFEHELFDAPQPTSVKATSPDGKTIDLTAKLEKFMKPGVDGKDVAAFRFDYTPEQRGDHWLVLHTPPIWMDSSKEFFQDIVQVVLHVQTQKGWDKVPGDQPRMEPLTRPYGLLPGMVFQARSPFPSIVEIERYNTKRPKEIPPDELVTFATKPDVNSLFTCTLNEPGWWSMTAQSAAVGKQMRDGKEYPVRQRVTLWVHVENSVVGK